MKKEQNEITKAEVIKQQEKIIPVTPHQLEMLNLKDPSEIVIIAKEVAKYVNSNALSVQIQGKPYVMVEGWQFVASLLGLVGMVEKIENKSSYENVEFVWQVNTRNGIMQKKYKTKLYKYFAEAVFKNPRTGQIVGRGFAMATNEEQKKHTFDEYAILSHAQTRAIGKAARMAFAFIIKAAGYEPTPAEEMEGVDKNKGNEDKTSVPADLIVKINEFKDVDKLLEWASSEENAKYHKSVTFRKLVKTKQEALKKSKKS